MEEIWKVVPDYGERYEVSNIGRVRNVKTGHIMRHNLVKNGSHVVQLTIPGECRTMAIRVHMLVAHAFLDNPHGRIYCRHKDGDKGNNRVDNLEWGNQAKGNSTTHKSRPCICTTPDGIELRFESTGRGASFVNGVSSGVSKCCRGEAATYKNHKWRYADDGD